MVNGPISTSSAISESRTMAQAPMRQFSPMVVPPRICAKGSTTVSMPMRTPRIDGHGLGLFDGHARQHQLAHLALAEEAVRLGQFQRGR